MVDEITPTYYAGSQPQMTYTLIGSGFDCIPDDAIGIKSNDNINPLTWLNNVETSRSYRITEKSNTHLVLTANYAGSFGQRTYLGCIVSNDRNVVIWVNDTQPLPPNRGDIVDTEIIDER